MEERGEGVVDEEWVARRRRLAAILAEKKVDLEVLCKEVELIEGMLEEL